MFALPSRYSPVRSRVTLRRPPSSVPVTAALPLTVRLPPSESEKALMPLVVESEVNVGVLGSFGRITFGNCLSVMLGPEISTS